MRRFWSRCGDRRRLGRVGVFSDLKEKFHGGRTPGCHWGKLADGSLSRQNPGTWSVYIGVGQMCCVPDNVFMIASSNTGERNVAIHTATGQDDCERDHEGGILEINSFLSMLFNDG